MTKVNINGSNHQVEIEHEGADLGYMIKKARQLWDATKPDQKPGPAFGYASEVHLPANGSVYQPASFNHREQPVVDR